MHGSRAQSPLDPSSIHSPNPATHRPIRPLQALHTYGNLIIVDLLARSVHRLFPPATNKSRDNFRMPKRLRCHLNPGRIWLPFELYTDAVTHIQVYAQVQDIRHDTGLWIPAPAHLHDLPVSAFLPAQLTYKTRSPEVSGSRCRTSWYSALDSGYLWIGAVCNPSYSLHKLI